MSEESGEWPPLHRLLVVLATRHEGGDPRPEPVEIAAGRWWDEHPAELRYPELARLPIPAPVG